MQELDRNHQANRLRDASEQLRESITRDQQITASDTARRAARGRERARRPEPEPLIIEDAEPVRKKTIRVADLKPAVDYMAVVLAFTLEGGSKIHGCKEMWQEFVSHTVRMTAYCGKDGIRENAKPEKPIDCKGCIKAIARAVRPKKRSSKRPNQWDRLAGKDPFRCR